MLVLLFITNVGMQGLFVYLLGTTDLTKPEYTEDEVVGYRDWRRGEAHSVSNYDRLRDQSLAKRVCNGDVISVSATIADNYGDVDAYLNSSKGSYMCGLALIAWYCTVSKEVNSTITSFNITISVPIGARPAHAALSEI